MTPRMAQLALIGSILLSLAAAPFLAKGDSLQQQTMEKNAIAIKSMAPAQRDRLTRNFADYLESDEESRLKVHALHAELEKNRQQHGDLISIMNSYMSWLKTLNPHQRDQLMKTTNPKLRIALMQDMIRKQREDQAQRNAPSFGRRSLDFLPTMDEKTRQQILQDLELSLSERLTAEQKQSLAMLTGLKRDVRVLQLLKEYGTGVTPQPLADFPPPELVRIGEHIEDYSSDPGILQFLKNGHLPPPEPEEGRSLGSAAGRRMAILLMHSLHVELIRQRHLQEAAEARVDSRTLEKFLATLPPDVQSDLLSLEVSDFQADLRKQYMESKTETNLPQKEQLDEIFFGKRWMFNGRRPGEGRPGDGRGGDGRGGGRPQRRMDGRDPKDDGFGPGRPPDGPFQRGGQEGSPLNRPEPPPNRPEPPRETLEPQ